MRVAAWPDTVTVTSRAPAAPAGVTAVSDVAPATTTLVAGLPPIVTVAPAAKLVPVSVTAVPPAVGPDAGDTAVSVGAGVDTV